MKKSILINHILLSLLICCVFSGIVYGGQEQKWPDAIQGGIDHLLDLSNPSDSISFDPDKIVSLLEFIDQSNEKGETLYTGGDQSYPSAHYSFKIKRSLEKILQYGFNPEISSVLLRPSSLRLSYWSEFNEEQAQLPKLWPYLSNLNQPVVLNGVEHIEITPDTNSKTYFSYDMLRTIIFLQHDGRKVMISLSHQKDKSEVGKKGLILGPDDNWDYVYTGEEGVNRRGLGWVKSRIYKSNNIMIFYENSDETMVECAIFNWIKAGWAGLNMVNNEHIYNGIIRFASDFKKILENSTLPEPSDLATRLARFEQMPLDELRDRTRIYFETLEERYADSDKKLAKLLEDPDYLKELQREEMVSMLIREYTKVLIGKQPATKAAYLLGHLNETSDKKEIISQ